MEPTLNSQQNCQLDIMNYIAILSLENLGINCPSQKQIDLMESAISSSIRPELLVRFIQEKIHFFIGDETVAKRIFLRQLNTNQ